MITDQTNQELIEERKLFDSTIVVFGGCGYIASHVSQLFMQKGAKKVMIFDRLSDGIYSRKRFEVLKAKKADCYELDLDIEDDFNMIEELIMQESNIDYVLYFDFTIGKYASVIDPHSICKEITRFSKTINLVSNIPSLRKFIYESSADVYGEVYNDKTHLNEQKNKPNPQNPYASMMTCCENIANGITGSIGLPTLGLRFFTIYGPDRRTTSMVDELELDLDLIGIWIKNAFFGQPLVVDCTYKDQLSLCHINDCAEFVVRASIGPMNNNKTLDDTTQILNIGDSFCVSKLEIMDLINTLVTSYLKRDKLCELDIKSISFIQSLITGEDETDDSDIVCYQQPDLSRLEAYTKYVPKVNLIKGMQDTISTCANIYIGQLQTLEKGIQKK
jgi:nucleoside-diphosphate-sugar epimerase